MESLGKVKEFVNDFSLWIILGLLVLVWSVMYGWRRRLRSPRKTSRDVTMTVEGRKLFVQKTILNAVCDGILDAYLNGDITSEEANLEMARIAKFYHHEEIIPLINDKKSKLLKHKLKQLKRRRSLNGSAKPLPLPTETSKAPVKPKDDGELLASILSS